VWVRVGEVAVHPPIQERRVVVVVVVAVVVVVVVAVRWVCVWFGLVWCGVVVREEVESGSQQRFACLFTHPVLSPLYHFSHLP
jgi:hypothetical protein